MLDLEIFIVTEIKDNSLGRTWGFNAFADAVNKACDLVEAHGESCDYEDMENWLHYYGADWSVCIGQMERS